MTQAFTLAVDPTGVALARLGAPDGGANRLDATLAESLAALVDRLESDPTIRGLVLASARADFVTGLDLDAVRALADAQEAQAEALRFSGVLRRLERAGKPVAAALAGRCVGGGLDLALACHHRVLLDDGRAQLGYPDVAFGLLPPGGGTQRLPRRVGLATAASWLLAGMPVDAATARASGLVDALATDEAGLLTQADAWVRAAVAAPAAPQDVAAVDDPEALAAALAEARRHGSGRHDVHAHLAACLRASTRLDLDAGLALEARHFAEAATGREARALVDLLWTKRRALERAAVAEPGAGTAPPLRRLGIVGAGATGAGIAGLAARAGLEVVLLDPSPDAALRGRAQAEAVIAQGAPREAADADLQADALARLTPAVRFEDLAGCSLVIEALAADPAAKAAALRAAEAQLDADAVLASHSATRPIGELEALAARPARFVGLHVLAPVERTRLVEIGATPRTDPGALARVVEVVRRLGRVPLVVHGDYTARVLQAYLLEAAALVGEGVPAAAIEAAALHAGMAAPPLALLDERSLLRTLQAADEATTTDPARPAHPGVDVLRRLCELGRVGRAASLGFHDWAADGPQAWGGLASLFPPAPETTPPTGIEIASRLVDLQANEAARCVEEGLVRSAAAADVGGVLGWGFPAALGGPLRHIDDTGAAAFVARLAQRAARHGERLAPARVVRHLADSGGRFDAPA